TEPSLHTHLVSRQFALSPLLILNFPVSLTGVRSVCQATSWAIVCAYFLPTRLPHQYLWNGMFDHRCCACNCTESAVRAVCYVVSSRRCLRHHRPRLMPPARQLQRVRTTTTATR